MIDQRPSPKDVYIGLDLGTSGLKGVAVSGSGAVIARASAAYPTRSPADGAFEQDPADWLDAIRKVAARLAEQVSARDWRGIGLSAMIPTLVTVDACGQPIGPAVTWQDSRADAIGAELRTRCGGEALYQVTGQWVDGRYLLPMYLRVAAEEPSRAAETSLLVGAKDYLLHWLTGQTITDPSTATGFGCYDLRAGRWHDETVAAAEQLSGLALPALPTVHDCEDWRPLLPEIARELGCQEMPVVVGAADSVLGALGLGVRAPGQVAYVAGTSTVIVGVTDRLHLDEQHRFLVTPMAEPGHWGLEMDLLATGSAIRWLSELVEGEANEAGVAELARGMDPLACPVVLPYLSPGEQGALWDPTLHGAVIGLSLQHGRAHLARGLLSGIILESLRCLRVLDELDALGAEITVAGCSAAATDFRADLADASGRRVAAPADHDTDQSALGAALLAARGVTGTSLAANAAEMQVTEPDPAHAEQWQRLWTRYERARTAIAGLKADEP